MDVRLFRQYDIRGFFARSWPREFLAVLCEAGYKTAVGKEELSTLDSHEAVKSIGFSCRVVAEAGCGQLDPLTFRRADPLIAVKSFSKQVAVATAEILAEAVQAAQIASLPRRFPTRDENPLLLVRVKVVTRIDRVRNIGGSGCNDESLFLAGLPHVF